MDTVISLPLSKKAWFSGPDGYDDIRMLNVNVDRGMVYFEGVNARGLLVRGELAMSRHNMNTLCLAWLQHKELEMKCCKCGTEIDVSKSKIPPMWFGHYRGCEMLKVICESCLRIVELSGHADDWTKGGDKHAEET